MLRDLFSIAIHRIERRATALFNAAHCFFQDVGQTAGIVARRHLAIDLHVLTLAVVQPPLQRCEQTLSSLAGFGAADEHSLRTEQLRRLGKAGRTAIAHKNIHRFSQRRVGRGAGKRV